MEHTEPIVVSRKDNTYVVTAAFPGVNAADISVQLLGHKVLDVTVRQHHESTAAAESDSKTESAVPNSPRKSPATRLPVSHSSTAEVEAPPAASSQESRVVMRRSVALPHMVDATGISCSYKDGLLRIHVPIMLPILSHDDDHTVRVDKLQQELKEAEELVSEFESKLDEHKAKAAAAREAPRSEKRASTEALRTHRHTLALAA